MPAIIWIDSDVEDVDDLIEIIEPPTPRKKPVRPLVGPSNILNTPTPRKKRPIAPASDSDVEIVEPTPKISRKQQKSKARELPFVVDSDDEDTRAVDDDQAFAAALQKQWDEEDALTRKRHAEIEEQSVRLIARLQEMDAKMAEKRQQLRQGKVPEDGIVFHVAIDAEGNTIEGDHDPDNAAHLEEVKRDFEQAQGSHLKVKNVHWFVNANLEARFEAAKELLKSRGIDATERNLFHGTAAVNIQPILENGFIIPGVTPGATMTHGAACGIGVYLATSSSTSQGYAQGTTKMFMCRVLTGRSVKQVSHQVPPPLAQSKFESYSGPGVYVVKYVDLVVPRYVVEFEVNLNAFGFGAGMAGLGVAGVAGIAGRGAIAGGVGLAGLGTAGGAGLGVAGGAGFGVVGGAGLGVAAGAGAGVVAGAGLGVLGGLGVAGGAGLGGVGVAGLGAARGAGVAGLGIAGAYGWGPGAAAGLFAGPAVPPAAIPVAPPIPVFKPIAAVASPVRSERKPPSKRTGSKAGRVTKSKKRN